MEFTPAGRSWTSPPLALQIVGLLLGGLVIAQLVTLILTWLLPPEPQPQYDLSDIANALRGDVIAARRSRRLQRIVQTSAPELVGPGWLTSERSRHELAGLLGRTDDDVQLYFFTPLPFAGTARVVPREAALEAPAGWLPRFAAAGQGRIVPASYVLLAQAGPPGPPPGAGGRPGVPGGPGGPGSLPGSPDGGNAIGPVRPADGGAAASRSGGTTPVPNGTASPAAPTTGPGSGPLDSIMLKRSVDPASNGGPGIGPDGGRTGAASDPSGSSRRPDARQQSSVSPSTSTAPGALPQDPGSPRPSARSPSGRAANGDAPGSPDRSSGRPSVRSVEPASPLRDRAVSPSGDPSTSTTGRLPRSGGDRPVAGAPIAAASGAHTLFGLGPAPFVEGDFVAAMRTADGWAVVQPVPEPFPNSWQRRVLLWFALAFALIAPLGWLFARRLVRPISGFAQAAERLGRDPTGPIIALKGPAEVGRAASAFNRMQSRLRSFVDDRTAMIGAISHDLRTPLTRLRFRIEDVEEDLRVGMLQEIEEMEAMITSVLAFIRDASEPGSREKLDLSSIVEDVVEDAVFVGNDVTLTLNQTASVEVDAIGMRRLLSNLVENAVKYGDHARVRLFTDRHHAITEISDDGPGLSDDELERVFQPFYRAAVARKSDKKGTGLGLAVCRSIARAHGGDVHLMRGEHGLIAQVRLPLAYSA